MGQKGRIDQRDCYKSKSEVNRPLSTSHDEVSVRLIEVTLTRHCEQPFGVAAEAVREICRKRKEGWIELWA
jgi:hypothetical protein